MGITGGTRQEGSPGSSTELPDRDYPPESPQRTKSRRTTRQRGGSITAEAAGKRHRTTGEHREPQSKDQAGITPESQDHKKQMGSTRKSRRPLSKMYSNPEKKSRCRRIGPREIHQQRIQQNFVMTIMEYVQAQLSHTVQSTSQIQMRAPKYRREFTNSISILNSQQNQDDQDDLGVQEFIAAVVFITNQSHAARMSS